MQIGVIGINHKLADVRLREILGKACGRGLSRSVHSAVLLSTCNRTEIYFSSPNLASTHSSLLGLLRQEIKEMFDHKMYSYFGFDCFFHLVRVTAGLDSAIVGETEIKGQVAEAYERASACFPLTRELHFLFQKSLKLGKEIHSHHHFGRGVPRLEEIVYQAGCDVLKDLKNKNILFIGASRINQKILFFFRQKGITSVTFCNRSHWKLTDLSSEVLEWSQIKRWIAFDLAVFGTKSPHPLVQWDDLAKMNGKDLPRKLVIDLSVPRNVDPKIGRHPAVTLLNIDQVHRLIERKKKNKSHILSCIETEMAQAVSRQMAIFRDKENKRLSYLFGPAFTSTLVAAS